jgi:exopolyphosphatase/guanosine-5'-triphosphate,3'-diphosphate pyrophosphatase
MKFGLIDIGSNTTKALIAKKIPPDTATNFLTLEQISFPCRLIPKSTHENFQIGLKEKDLLINCLSEIKQTCKNQSVEEIRTVATEAFRKASNALQIVEEVKQCLGLNIEIISGIEEAMAVVRGLQTDPMLKDWQNFIAIDIGGGSLELIQVQNHQVIEAKSLPLGAVRMAQMNQVDLNDPIKPEIQSQLTLFLRQLLKAEIPTLGFSNHQVVVTGGTVVYLRKLLERETHIDSSGVIKLLDIESVSADMSRCYLKERINQYPEIPSDRADIFPYGLITIIEVMKFIGADQITHSFHNLRYGLMCDLMEATL